MAALTVDHLTTITRPHKMKKLIDNIWDDSYFFMRLLKRGRILWQSGDPFEIPIEYKKDVKGGAYAKTDERTYAIREFTTTIKYERKFYSEPIILYDRDLDVNKGPDMIVNNVVTTVRQAMDCLKDDIYTDFFRDTSTVLDPNSVKINTQMDLLNQTTSTAYGNLAANQFSGWIASLDAGTTTLATLTNYQLKYRLRLAYKGRGRRLRPSIGYTTQTIWNTVEDIEDPKVRGDYSSELHLGKETIWVDGVPLVVDTFQQAGYLTFINEDYFHVFIHTNDNFKLKPWQESEVVRGKVSDATVTAQTGCTRRDVHCAFNGLS